MNLSKAQNRERKQRKERGFSDTDEIVEKVVNRKRQKERAKKKKDWVKQEG
jgi:hypothetical protein